MKFKNWPGESLLGVFELSRKIDGVDVRISDGIPYSKGGKVFENLEEFISSNAIEDGIWEFYRTDWAESVSLVKNSARKDEILLSDFYTLSPETDQRLSLGTITNPSASYIENRLKEVVKEGHEGLVIHNPFTDAWIKVKTKYTIDLRCLGFEEGVGKYNKGMVGVLLFELNGRPIRVSSGITKFGRIAWFTDPTLINSIFEISFVNKTPDGSLRHPAITRRRWDRNTESLE
jgi:hypothetical protein